MSEEKVTFQVGDRISGEVVLVAEVRKLVRPTVEYDKRRSCTYHLDREGARKLVRSLNAERKQLATIQQRFALRLDDGRYLILDLHQRIIEVTDLPQVSTA